MAGMSVAQAMARAKSHERAARSEAARGLYLEVLARFPGNAKARQRLARLDAKRPAGAAPPRGELERLAGLLGRGGYSEVADAAQGLLRLYPDAAVLWNMAGLAWRGLGQDAAAEAAFRQAIEKAPGAVDGHVNLGAMLKARGQLDAAIACFEGALRLQPGHAGALNNLGNALTRAGRAQEAIAAYRNALRAQPGHGEARRNLCELLEKLNDLDGLDACLEQAGETRDPEIAHFRALAAYRRHRFEVCAVALEGLDPARLPDRLRPDHLWLRASLADRMGATERAFAGFEAMNRAAAGLDPEAVPAAAAFLAEKQRLAEALAGAPSLAGAARPAEPEQPGQAEAPIFLVGFPRSGTTLLGTLLQGHSQLAVIEEKEALGRVLAQCPEAGDLARLEAMDAAQLRDLRALYLAEIGPAESPGGWVIDKMPLNLIHAPLIHHLFPQARFLLALRHPMDCVLSGFMQNFRLNPAMANMLTLERAAALYDLSMDIFDKARRRYGLSVRQLRYEDLVGRTEATLSEALDFLGLELEAGMQDHRATARRRGRIDTPSYAQVTQPIYSDAQGRWRRYGAHMEEGLPLLAPWAQRFGYDM